MTALNPDERPAWMQYANCLGVDPDLMFPGRGNNYEMQDAKAVCSACSVKADCLEYALENHEQFGVWGGTSERERRTIRRDRGLVIRRAPLKPCGTTAAYDRHRRDGETPCRACKDAMNRARNGWRSA